MFLIKNSSNFITHYQAVTSHVQFKCFNFYVFYHIFWINYCNFFFNFNRKVIFLCDQIGKLILVLIFFTFFDGVHARWFLVYVLILFLSFDSIFIFLLRTFKFKDILNLQWYNQNLEVDPLFLSVICWSLGFFSLLFWKEDICSKKSCSLRLVTPLKTLIQIGLFFR